jgi:PA14 domain/Dolichyl-phosphate-mannose-protein mannosyltransferase
LACASKGIAGERECEAESVDVASLYTGGIMNSSGSRGGRPWKSWLFVSAVAAALLAAMVMFAVRLDPLPQGLTAEYFSNPIWAPPTAFSALENPSTKHLVDAWSGSPPAAFSTTWAGAVIALREGTYTFATVSDDGSSVFVDGQLVVDNGGRHSALLAAGSVHLARGAHAVFIRYFQDGGLFHFDLLWARDGSRLRPVPAWALRPRKGGSFARLIPSVLVSLALAPSQWICCGLVLLAFAVAVWPFVVRTRRLVEQGCAWATLRWILAGSMVLNLPGIWWGLPGNWVPIEASPESVLNAWSQRFAHGWFDAYPPFHYYLLTIAVSPILLLQSLDITTDAATGYALMTLVWRLVSIAAALGILIATCLCGTHAFGRRAGLFAAASFAVVTPFVFYSKTANFDVPYLFWFAISLVFYLRLLDGLRLQDYVLFAASATCAVCTKDQAYALYLLAPPVIVHRMWWVNRQRGLSHPLWRAVFDRRIAAAAVTAAMLFAVGHNLFFNLGGFLSHVRLISGPMSRPYRQFEPTRAGRLGLLRLTVQLIEVSWGWPLFLVAVTGVVVAVATPRLRRVAAWLAVPVVSYYLGFINVILYNYDRFVLPICFVLALFGGLALDLFLTPGGRGRNWRIVAVTGMFAYTLFYAGMVDVLMIEDSRYAVEKWAKLHIGPDDRVGVTELSELLPRLDDFSSVDIGSIDELERERPLYFVLNADYARAVPSDLPWGRLIAGLQNGTLGYRLVARFRRGSPWPWLPGAHPSLAGSRQEIIVFSVLRDIDPAIEIFQCDTPICGPLAAAPAPGSARSR